MWWKSVLLIVVLVLMALFVAVGYGSRRWQAKTMQMRASLEAVSVDVEPGYCLRGVGHTGEDGSRSSSMSGSNSSACRTHA